MRSRTTCNVMVLVCRPIAMLRVLGSLDQVAHVWRMCDDIQPKLLFVALKCDQQT